jgi:N-methylhydantoinase A/oxoprolinase/acetone carboxylase beta subunit
MSAAPKPMLTPLYLGIDTGGTFTDGVLLDPATRQVVKKAKVLTSHHDLRLCIAGILDALVTGPATPISLVALSTTLATNSIAEGKSRPVALFLLGYDPDLVYKFEFERQFGDSLFFFIHGRHDLNGREVESLDLAHLDTCLGALDRQAEAVAISSLVGMRNPAHEQAAADLASRLTRLPIVQGHQLSDNLDSIRRATTARLNASLLSTTFDFLQTVQAMLAQKGITSPLYVVKGDGSLASAGYAAGRPVEMIHSGPATSAIGGSYLVGTESALVIDMGGTTTDLALTGPGRTLAGDGEATVGEYRTALRTIRAHSFGLGGDSLIRFDPHGGLSVGPERVMPLAFLAHHYPAARQDLLDWLSSPPAVWYSDRIEYWLLRQNGSRPTHQPADERARKALALLQNGPLRVRSLLKQVGVVSPVQVGADPLIRQDVISVAGLTPTDLLHASGEFTPWDSEVAHKAVAAAAAQWGISIEAFIQKARDTITRRITTEIIQFLTGAALPAKEFGFARKDLTHFMFDENMAPADPFLGVQFQLKVPMVGIGAPARAFLMPVAQALHTDIHFPEHYEVANAVGTVVGNVLVHQEGEVLQWVENNAQLGSIGRAGGVQRSFGSQTEALLFVRQALGELALNEARAAGAPFPTLDLEERELSDGTIHLVARAAGKPF